MKQRHDNPVIATLTAVRENLSGRGKIAGALPSDRLDGKTALVTGSNSGLGKATAIHLAKRGARVVMACRSNIPEAGEEVCREAGVPPSQVQMLHVDLSDLVSIDTFCDILVERGERFDVAIFNAGVMPASASRSAQGFELMFAVNFLAKTALLERMLRDGVIPNDTFADNGVPFGEPRPRIVFVSSETHRTADDLEIESLGEYVDYGLTDGMKQYGHTKLCLSTYAVELSRRLGGSVTDDDGAQVPDVSVHHLCPGPVNSNMARSAPAWVKPLLFPVMKLLFNSPEVAAEPVVYLACGRALEGETGRYLHMMREKTCGENALDPAAGRAVFERATELRAQARVERRPASQRPGHRSPEA